MCIYVYICVIYVWSRDSSVGRLTSYGLDCRGSNPSSGKILLVSTASRPALGPTLPPIQWVPGALSPGVKLTTHLYLVSQEWWSYTTTPPYVFMA
jgi:hypothetical protein